MFEKENINLIDLIDIKFLQEFQDVFANTMNVASIMVNNQGPITTPSNFTDFCIKYTRGSAEGYKRCNECDIRCGKNAAETGKPVIYTCHSGLTDFAVPIVVDGQHIASILGGQILTAKPDEKHFRALAQELGINEEEYIEALNKINIVPIETIKAAANLLYVVANSISEISHKNLKLIKKNEHDLFNKKITEIIIKSKDIEEILSFICSEAAKIFGVQRVAIATFSDLNNYKDCTIRHEYKISPDIKGIECLNYFNQQADFWGDNLVNKGDFWAIDSIAESGIADILKNDYNRLGIKAMIGVPIKNKNDYWGILVLSDYNNCRHWTDDEISLLNAIADQIYIAIKQAELYNTLQLSAINQNAILNNIPFMVWLKDEKGRLLTVNEAYAKMCNKPIEEVIGKTDFDFFPKEEAEVFVKDDNFVMEQGHTILTEEPITGPNGEIWHETIKSPLFDSKGKLLGTVGMSRDVTEKKKIEKMKNEFVSTVSHELRTPLTAIRGALGLILSGAIGESPDKIKNLVNIANSNCIRLTNLINDILDLEKIKAGKYDFVYEELEINSLLEQSIMLNESYAEQFGMKIKFIKSFEDAYIKADKNRTLQVVSNLISNAVKFSKLGGVVCVISEIIHNNVRVSIVDEGIGIPDDSKYKIFQSFSQVDSSDTRSKGGTGLGLSISKLIIESMGGNIGFESESGKGSTFFFILPNIEKGSFIKSDDTEIKELNIEEF